MILSRKNFKAKTKLSNSLCELHQSLIGSSKVGVANNSTICFSGHDLLLKPCRVFCCCLLLLFHHDVVVFVFVFCLYFQVRTGRQHQEERKFTLRFFSCFFYVLFHFLFLCCMFFFFRQFLLKSKLVFFQGQKNGMGDAMIFCLDFLFFRLRFLPRFSALCWLPRQGCFS